MSYVYYFLLGLAAYAGIFTCIQYVKRNKMNSIITFYTEIYLNQIDYRIFYNICLSPNFYLYPSYSLTNIDITKYITVRWLFVGFQIGIDLPEKKEAQTTCAIK